MSLLDALFKNRCNRDNEPAAKLLIELLAHFWRHLIAYIVQHQTEIILDAPEQETGNVAQEFWRGIRASCDALKSNFNASDFFRNHRQIQGLFIREMMIQGRLS